MKKVFFLVLLISGIASAQIVNIPDANFKANLIGAGNDTNADGEIQVSEALMVTSIFINGDAITSMVGISSFENLTSLQFRNVSGVSTLDLSNLSSLSNVYLSHLNGLTSLNITGCSALINLHIDNVPHISALDLHNYTNLTDLFINGLAFGGTGPIMDLTNINLTGCSALKNLTVAATHISSLDVATCSSLEVFQYEDNLVPNLNLSGLTHLTTLYASSNSTSNTLLSVNAQGCTALTTVDVRYNTQLHSLYLKNGANETVNFFASPNLVFICADESQLAEIQSNLQQAGYNLAVCNSYCSFTPGGDYNTISGTIKYDFDNNGCDSNDLVQPNIRVNVNQGANQSAAFTSNAGNFTFYTQAGSFDLTPAIENPSWFTFSPATATIPFADNNNNTATQDFCITANGVHPDLEVTLAPVIPARPGFDAVYTLVYRNKGNVSLSSWTGLSLTYDNAKMSFLTASQPAASSTPGFLDFGYSVNPFESGAIEITFHINTPSDASPVNIGDHLGFTATVTPVVSDENPADNTFNYTQTVLGSFDPNDITCIDGNVVSTAQIGQYLHYIINFENTGTADAQNIVVSDLINQEQFDLSSLQVVNSSDPVTAKLTGNIAEFIFQNINLHSGGHGNILIKIKSKGTLAQGDNVSKQANIYFDYNAPVATNIENTVFQSLSNPSFPVDATISMYPNPTPNVVNIKASNNITSVQLFDVQGRLLQTKLVNENNTLLDISTQSAGIYFIKVTTEKGIKVEKIVKE